jgi:hypothetical protein
LNERSDREPIFLVCDDLENKLHEALIELEVGIFFISLLQTGEQDVQLFVLDFQELVHEALLKLLQESLAAAAYLQRRPEKVEELFERHVLHAVAKVRLNRVPEIDAMLLLHATLDFFGLRRQDHDVGQYFWREVFEPFHQDGAHLLPLVDVLVDLQAISFDEGPENFVERILVQILHVFEITVEEFIEELIAILIIHLRREEDC